MLQKLTAAVAALVLGLTALAPVAEARDHRGRHGGYYDRGHYDRGYHGHRRDNDNDELAAGVIGLALGAVLGASLASSSNRNSAPRYDDRYYAPPPPPPPRYAPQSYYDDGYDRGYDRGCVREVRTWDPYYGRYEYVQLRGPC